MTKYCSICGKEIHENAVICPYCGCQVVGSSLQTNDKASIGLNILSFLIPLAGLILFCVNIGNKPNAAKSYGLWALGGVLIGFCVSGCTALMV